MPSLLRSFVALNRRICRGIDRWIPERFSVDGNRDFVNRVVPRYLQHGFRIVDAGGGKTPFFSMPTKQMLGLTVIGLDISEAELRLAPAGAYDAIIVADICDTRLEERADVAVCMTVIEHVTSAHAAVASLARLVKPGGTVALLAPCRNAAFARLNMLLPEGLKRRVLHGLYPETVRFAGFVARYDRCTPSALAAIMRGVGLRVVEQRVYHWSGYFDFFAPLYACWRAASLVAIAMLGDDACDRFCLVAIRDA